MWTIIADFNFQLMSKFSKPVDTMQFETFFLFFLASLWHLCLIMRVKSVEECPCMVPTGFKSLEGQLKVLGGDRYE